MESLADNADRRADRVAAVVLTVFVVASGMGGAAVLHWASNVGADDAFWSPYPTMAYPRAWPGLVQLPDGDIMVVGGLSTGGPTATTEVFDIDEEQWIPGPTMSVPRVGHTTTLLEDGTVLAVGGETGDGATASAEVIDLSEGVCYPLPDMILSRFGHAASMLPSGRVLVSGGSDGVTDKWSQAEIYDPGSQSWLPADAMSQPRQHFSMHLLENGEVIAVGGGPDAASELYDEAADSWHGEADMLKKRICAASILTPSGHVLVAGGIGDDYELRSAEMYDPDEGLWFGTDSMRYTRAHFTLSLLDDGRILAAGSWSDLEGVSNTAELFCQCSMTWSTTTPMLSARGGHGAALLPDGNVLLIGGRGVDGVTSSTEQYTPPTLPPEPPPTPPPPYCEPKDILPFVALVADAMPGYSENGLVAKVLVAQKYFEEGDLGECLRVLDAFYNQVRAFLNNEHVDEEEVQMLYEAYASVVDCLGGEPQPEIP
ncbi:MAG: hypothetical protein JSV90_03975 [Methanobacteriota archaeon]|nr:MAG: hypothetical protein JSV90_03975 [Euryarchaeota archaeon]